MCDIKIERVENGFTVEVEVPLKDSPKPGIMACCEVRADKEYIAKDEAEVLCLLESILPLISKDFKTEEDFDTAFKTATKEPHCGGK
jgi:hypothetical protein